jgi:hypothetical protein
MRLRLAILAGAALAACGPKKHSQLDIAECSVRISQGAANRIVSPILTQIADPASRDAGCTALDQYIRMDAVAFDDLRPKNCEWDYGGSSPRELVDSLLKRHSATLAKLCDWDRKDSARSFEKEGKETLSGYSPEQRDELRRTYGQ